MTSSIGNTEVKGLDRLQLKSWIIFKFFLFLDKFFLTSLSFGVNESFSNEFMAYFLITTWMTG